MNEQRADWVAHAIIAFADETMGGEISEDTISDLICNIGHYAKREFGFSKQEVLALYENGIGSWVAENEAAHGDPRNNTHVQILVG